MPTAISLNIGLNHVDPVAYGGWDGALSGCINDANSMRQIAVSQGFTAETVIDAQATAANVIAKISDACRQLVSGDFFLLTYSGHGGQVVDNTGEEYDGLNETWVLWDRQLIDNELYSLLSQFRAGVRIFISSDSCHSGTLLRSFLRSISVPEQHGNMFTMKPKVNINYKTAFDMFASAATKVYPQLQRRSLEAPDPIAVPRAMPEAVAMQNYEDNKLEYNALRSIAGSKNLSRANMSACVIYISGCQDAQFSYDGPVNGAFTTQLLNVWANGSFNGCYPTFWTQIRDAMNNPSQIPEYHKEGPVPAEYENSKPYSLGAGMSTSGGSTSGGSSSAGSTTTAPVAANGNPSMSAPSVLNRQGAAPVFQVNKGANPYYYIELATDYNLFTYGSTGRNSNNFFATWGERFTTPLYQVPDAVWSCLKNAEKIYYKVGSTSSQVGAWDNLKMSFDNVSEAPFITLQDGERIMGASMEPGMGRSARNVPSTRVKVKAQL